MKEVVRQKIYINYNNYTRNIPGRIGPQRQFTKNYRKNTTKRLVENKIGKHTNDENNEEQRNEKEIHKKA